MGYYSGQVNTSQDMLSAIEGAAVAEGWSVVHRGTDPGGGDTNSPFRPDVLCLRDSIPSGYDFALAFQGFGVQDTLRVYGLNGAFNDQVTTESQAGSKSTTNFAYIPCLKYHLFVEQNYIYGIIEGQVGHFRHFGLGYLDKGDSYPGGNFLYGHYAYQVGNDNIYPFLYRTGFGTPNNTFSALVGGDGYAPRWRNNRVNVSFPDRVAGGLGDNKALTENLLWANESQVNGLNVFMPHYCSVERQGGYDSPIGMPPDMRVTARLSATAGQTLTLGPDSWMIFPIGKWGSAAPWTDSKTDALVYFLRP